MRHFVLLDELHVEVLVPQSIRRRDLAALRRQLRAPEFLPRVRRAIRPLLADQLARLGIRLRVGR
jgi:hypothetical protein